MKATFLSRGWKLKVVDRVKLCVKLYIYLKETNEKIPDKKSSDYPYHSGDEKDYVFFISLPLESQPKEKPDRPGGRREQRK
jgi:hypothetical protein